MLKEIILQSGVRCINTVMTVFPGFKLRVGQRSGREQENSERRHPRREHASGTRQVQDPQTDPVRKHQTAHRRVRMHVMSAFSDAKAHTAGPFCLDCSPASLKLFPLYPNKSDPQHGCTSTAQCSNMDLINSI